MEALMTFIILFFLSVGIVSSAIYVAVFIKKMIKEKKEKKEKSDRSWVKPFDISNFNFVDKHNISFWYNSETKEVYFFQYGKKVYTSDVYILTEFYELIDMRFNLETLDNFKKFVRLKKINELKK